MRTILLDDLARCIGFGATCVVITWFGGRKLYVPKTAAADHPLRALLGDDAFEALVEEFPAVQLDVPAMRDPALEQRDRAIAERLAAGDTVAMIAATFGLSQRRAEQIRAELVQRGWLAYVSSAERRMRRGRPKEPCKVQIFSERANVSSDPHPSAEAVRVLQAWPRRVAA